MKYSFRGAGLRISLAAAVSLILAGADLPASEKSRVRTVEQLQAARGDLSPLVLIKGNEARLYFTNADQQVMFKAEWSHKRLQTGGFNSHLATLKFDPSPPAMPRTPGHWKEARVLALDEWKRFVESAVGRLAPVEAGHGVYLQFALGEAAVIRNATGKAKVGRYADLAGISIDRRLSPSEAAAALASALEADLKVEYPENERFALVPPASGSHADIVLLDLAQRSVVTLVAPRAGDDPRGGVRVGSSLSGLITFAVVDTGWCTLKNPVSVACRVINEVIQWPASLLNPPLRNRAPAIPLLTNVPGMDLTAWERWLDSHTATVQERGSIRLLINGERFYPAFEERLARASRSIDINVCIFDRDDVATHMADLLKQRSTNVEVRVIFDHTSTRTSGNTPPGTPMPPDFFPPKAIGSYLRQDSHVQVRPYLNPFLSSDHRKVFLVDEQYAYIGGMNIGREYRYEWHDLMSEIEGPVVASLQREFDRNWAYAGPGGDLAYAGCAVFSKRRDSMETNRSDFIDLRRIYTKTGRNQIRRAVLESIRRAQKYVFLENPYLYDNSVIVAAVKARLRGVDVRVVLPDENDISGGSGSNLVTANYLLRHGVRVYFYPGMTHVKALLVDGWVCYGSANFNTLSLRLNQEADIATSDAGFSTRFRHELFETDFEKSYELKEPAAVGWADHLADSILNQF